MATDIRNRLTAEILPIQRAVPDGAHELKKENLSCCCLKRIYIYKLALKQTSLGSIAEGKQNNGVCDSLTNEQGSYLLDGY